MINKSALIISLDFELYWGVFDKVELADKINYFDNTRRVVTSLLEVFVKNELHVTWATVGMLFLKDWEEWQLMMPKKLPTYRNRKLSAYSQKSINSDTGLDRFFFAPELVSQIIQAPNQELATHTYSHYYCNEQEQTIEQFRFDLIAAKKIATKFNSQLSSLVFPRNQFNKEYLEVCFQEGITNVRSNPRDWFWKDTVSDRFIYKVFRTGDVYFPLGKRTSFTLSSLIKEDNMPVSIPASRFLRPITDNNYLNQLRIKRILNEMTEAAKRNECYHLWWHPHNFGERPEQSLSDLKRIIEHYKSLNQQYGMVSMTMQETGLEVEKLRNYNV